MGLEALASWCREYGGTVERGPYEVKCRFAQDTYVKFRGREEPFKATANAAVDNHPKHISGAGYVDVDHGLHTVVVGDWTVEPRSSIGVEGSTLQARRHGGAFDFTGGGL